MVVLMTRHRALIALAGLGLLLGITVGVARSAARQAPARLVDVSAERFTFTPSEFRVKAGEPVDIRLTSDDTNHGFRIVGAGVDVTIPKRGKGAVTVRFQAPQPGRFVFECSKLCGAGHSFMRGTIIAE